MIIHNDRQELQKALQYVEEELKKYNLNRREATMTMLMAEESLVCMKRSCLRSCSVIFL